jgi:murein tripeptide amidase MpaA
VNRRSIKAAKLNKRFALGKIEINPTEEEAKEFGFGKEDKKEEERPAWTHINLLRNKYFNKK